MFNGEFFARNSGGAYVRWNLDALGRPVTLTAKRVNDPRINFHTGEYHDSQRERNRAFRRNQRNDMRRAERGVSFAAGMAFVERGRGRGMKTISVAEGHQIINLGFRARDEINEGIVA